MIDIPVIVKGREIGFRWPPIRRVVEETPEHQADTVLGPVEDPYKMRVNALVPPGWYRHGSGTEEFKLQGLGRRDRYELGILRLNGNFPDIQSADLYVTDDGRGKQIKPTKLASMDAGRNWSITSGVWGNTTVTPEKLFDKCWYAVEDYMSARNPDGNDLRPYLDALREFYTPPKTAKKR